MRVIYIQKSLTPGARLLDEIIITMIIIIIIIMIIILASQAARTT